MATRSTLAGVGTRSVPGQARAAFLAFVVGPAVLVTVATTARADDSMLHRVTYTVNADQPLDADIYYRDVDPPDWADYSHNPYVFSPKTEAALGPGTPWVLDIMLADPAQWAMVAVAQDVTRATRTVRCTLAIDGNVVATADGPTGALCAIRHW